MDQAYTNAVNPKRLSSLLHLGHACWIGDGWKTFDLAYSTRDKLIFSSQFTSWTNWTSNDLKPVAKLSFLHPSDDVGSSWGIWSSCFHKNLTTSHDNLQTFEPVVEWDASSAGYFSILSPLLNWRGTLVTLYFVFQPQLGCWMLEILRLVIQSVRANLHKRDTSTLRKITVHNTVPTCSY